MKRNTPVVVGFGLVLLGFAQTSHAQTVATVNAVVRVVKTAPPNSTALTDARVGTPLAPGGRVRTGGRSKAGILFTDKSTLKLDELTEVIISGGRQRDTRVLGGRVFGEYTRPGTITGGYATAAVRGTKVIYFEKASSETAYIRCYEGSTFVGTPGVKMRSGLAEAGSPTTLTDSNLIDDSTNWTDSTLKIVGGANDGQERLITGFDPAMGTLTVGPAFPSALDNTSEYLITTDSRSEFVRLRAGEGTQVTAGRVGAPYRVAGEKFAEGERSPWFEELKPGVSIKTFPGTLTAQIIQTQTIDQRQGADVATDNPDVGDLDQIASGNLVVIIPPIPRPRPVHRPEVSQAGAGQQGGVRETDQTSSGVERIAGALLNDDANMTSPQPNPATHGWFRAEPFGVVGSGGHLEGFRLRAQSVWEDLYLELGGRFYNADSLRKVELSEGFFQWRTEYADVLFGRQHVFLGPANNLSIGQLLGFETVDAVIVRPVIEGRYSQEFGYIMNTSPNFGRGYRGVYTRGQLALDQGLIGWQLFDAFLRTNQLGWSADVSFPVIPDAVDAYGEGGVDPFHHTLITAGLYFPVVYESTGLDVFMEYGDRQTFKDRIQLRVQKDIGLNWFVLAFAEKEFGGAVNGGGGVQYSVRFP